MHGSNGAPAAGRRRMALLRLQQQSPADDAASSNTLFSRCRALAAVPRPDRVLLDQRDAVTYQVYEPPYGYHYLKRPYELCPKRAEAVVEPHVLRQGRPARCPTTRRPIRSPRASTTSRSRRASCSSRTRRSRRTRRATTATTRLKRGRARRSALAAGVRAQGTRELVAEDFVYAHQAPRDDAHHGADLRHLHRVRGRAEGLRRADQARGRQAARGPGPGGLDKPFLDFRRWPLAGASAPEQHTAAHPHHRQVPAVEVLDGDDLHGADAVGGRRVLCPARHGRSAA